VRDQVKWFATRMENKLAANDHKVGWQGEPDYYFTVRMKEELKELQDALMSGDKTAAINECADVANFAMMLANNLWVAREREMGFAKTHITNQCTRIATASDNQTTEGSKETG